MKKVITISMDVQEVEELRQRAGEQNRSISNFIRHELYAKKILKGCTPTALNHAIA